MTDAYCVSIGVPGMPPVYLKLLIVAEAVKDQRADRLARHGGVSNHELNAIPTQNALKPSR
jgi:hypothetical protein